MNAIQETLTQILLDSKTERELIDSMSKAAQVLEFEYFAYGLRIPLPISNPKIHMFSNYAQAWQKKYIDAKYFLLDPTVKHCSTSTSPIIWNELLFSSCQEFWDEARSHHLQVGLAQGCQNAMGVSGMLTLARSNNQLSLQEKKELSFIMSWLTLTSFECTTRILLPELMPEINVKLSDREIQVLRWTAEGKTSAEVSEIMKIAERTVNFHINNAIEKLGASNKTSATVKAVVLGLL